MTAVFKTAQGVVAVLPLDDVNTDVIIPTTRSIMTARQDLGRYAFEPLRYDADGRERPEFPLNRPDYRGAPILLAGNNFGCGSSREPAVWALHGMGFRCIIAGSFGGIFYANCFRSGVLPVMLAEQDYAALRARAAAGVVTASVDLDSCTVRLDGGPTFAFRIEEERRQGLLQGLDEIGQTLLSADDIRAFQARDRIDRPWVWEPVRLGS